MRLGVAEPAGHIIERAFERRVGERTHLPALGADEVVMVVPVWPRRLEPGDPVTEVDSRDEALGGEELEDAVDTRNPDAAPGRAQLAM